MRNDNLKTLCWTAVALAFIASVTAVKLQPSKTLGPEYIVVNGKEIACAAIMVTQTDSAGSCDWDALREED